MITQGNVSIVAHVLLVLKASPHICKHDRCNCSHCLTGVDKVVGNGGS